MKEKLRKVFTDAGVLFSIANVFAFLQSDSFFAKAFAIVIATMTITAAGMKWDKVIAPLPPFVRKQASSPLYINAWGGLTAGLFSLAAGSLLPGIAGLAFTTGNFLAVSRRIQNLQHDGKAEGWLKALTHPAIYFGVGYTMIGLMAGGGARLFADPFGNIPALIMTCLGVSAIALSTIGMISGAFPNPAAPFMAVVFGTFINIWAGIFSGNLIGAVNNFFAMSGEFRLAWDADARHGGQKAANSSALARVSQILLAPLRRARRRFG